MHANMRTRNCTSLNRETVKTITVIRITELECSEHLNEEQRNTEPYFTRTPVHQNSKSMNHKTQKSPSGILRLVRMYQNSFSLI